MKPLTDASAARAAGSIPNTTPVRTESASAKSSTRPSARTENMAGRNVSVDHEQRACAEYRDQDAERTARNRNDDRFGERLAHEPCAAAAERRTHGQLVTPPERARERQVGEVGARDEENECRGALKQKQRRTQLARPRCVQRQQQRTTARVCFGVLRLQAGPELIHLCTGGGQ